jgi:predicted metal-binding membrane protein
MASLFALGVMSIVWMAVVAGLIAFEKVVPSRRAATDLKAAILLVLGVLQLRRCCHRPNSVSNIGNRKV